MSLTEDREYILAMAEEQDFRKRAQYKALLREKRRSRENDKRAKLLADPIRTVPASELFRGAA